MTKSVFAYRNGTLCVEALPLVELAEEIDTPFYCTSVKQLRRNLHSFFAPFKESPVKINYAMKENGTLAMVRALAQEGSGVDVTCVGELSRAIEANVASQHISFSGKSFSHDDVLAVLLAGVDRINVASLSDLLLIEGVAVTLNKSAPIVLRFDPDNMARHCFDPCSLDSAIQHILKSDSLVLRGLALPREEKEFSFLEHVRRIEKLSSFVWDLYRQDISVEHIGLGAGPAFLVQEDKAEKASLYVRVLDEMFDNLVCSFSFEPGEILTRGARALITRVVQSKKIDNKMEMTVDAYQNKKELSKTFSSKQEIMPMREASSSALFDTMVHDVVGGASEGSVPACLLPEMMPNDLLVMTGVCVRGDALTPALGRRPLAPEILVSGARHAVVRRCVAVVEQMA
ncbi:MAG TPA: hypothetical protein DD400_03285, partial [Rhodospirillaceae bacterium]|nr:hypothetical protein [Rhodospirillaceae bacterium]